MDSTSAKQQKKRDLLDHHFQSAASPSAGLSLDLKFADLKLRWNLIDGSKEDFNFLKHYFKPFLFGGDSNPDVVIHYQALTGVYESIHHPLWSGDVYSVTEPRGLGGRYYLQRDFASVLDETGTEIRCLGPQIGPGNTLTIDNLMSFSLAEQLLKRGRILLHASSCVVDGQAWLFMGPSGVGKSTLCNRMADEGLPILSGDRLYLFFEQGMLKAAPSPISIAGFARDDSRRSFESYPVSHIFQLKKWQRYHFQRIQPSDLGLAILEETLCFQPEFIDHRTHFQLCTEILNAPQVFWGQLSYPKNQPILEYIKRNLAGGLQHGTQA